MVTNVTSLTGNGLKDWLIQRATAVFLFFYMAALFLYVLAHPHLDYLQWSQFFHCIWIKLASILAVIFILMHAWIGIWTVTTDYIKCTVLRLSVQALVATALLVEVVWGIMIVWGQ